jgi:hypothetical protein
MAASAPRMQRSIRITQSEMPCASGRVPETVTRGVAARPWVGAAREWTIGRGVDRPARRRPGRTRPPRCGMRCPADRPANRRTTASWGSSLGARGARRSPRRRSEPPHAARLHDGPAPRWTPGHHRGHRSAAGPWPDWPAARGRRAGRGRVGEAARAEAKPAPRDPAGRVRLTAEPRPEILHPMHTPVQQSWWPWRGSVRGGASCA